MAEVVRSPMQGTVAVVGVRAGDEVRPGHELVVIESMKMEHVVAAECAGVVDEVSVRAGDAVRPGDALVTLRLVAADSAPTDESTVASQVSDPTVVRSDLAEVVDRHRLGLDPARPEAVAKRHARGQRTARENITDLVDDGSFVEYAPLAVAAQ